MKKGFTELIFIIDRNCLMGDLNENAVDCFNSMLKEQQIAGEEAVLTTVLFDDRCELLHDRINIQAAVPLKKADYKVQGNAALLDAIGKTMHKIRKVQRSTKEEFRAEKVMFVIITGSHENASHVYTADMIRQRIEHRKQKYGWKFIFFGVDMNAVEEAGKIGIAGEWAHDYRADPAGTKAAYTAISAMLTDFRIGKEADINESDRELIRKHWKSTAVFTDVWTPGEKECKVPEEELLPGELAAVTFRVGCYIVRSAQRVYRVYDPGYTPQEEQPADKKEVELIRGLVMYDDQNGQCVWNERAIFTDWKDKLRLTHEISARHVSNPNGGFIYVCRAAQARNYSWFEYIGDIFAVKENELTSDEYASLLVYSHYEGSCFGADTWYKLDPDGRVTKLEPGAYGIIPEERQFK